MHYVYCTFSLSWILPFVSLPEPEGDISLAHEEQDLFHIIILNTSKNLEFHPLQFGHNIIKNIYIYIYYMHKNILQI